MKTYRGQTLQRYYKEDYLGVLKEYVNVKSLQEMIHLDITNRPRLLEILQIGMKKEDLNVILFNSKNIPDEVWHKLKAHYWPGNVRELRNVIERCVLFSEGPTFPGQWLQLPGQPTPTGIIKNDTPLEEVDSHSLAQANKQGIYLPLDGNMALEDMDRFIIKTALERADNNLTAAARALGATRETLRYRVRKYNLNTVD